MLMIFNINIESFLEIEEENYQINEESEKGVEESEINIFDVNRNNNSPSLNDDDSERPTLSISVNGITSGSVENQLANEVINENTNNVHDLNDVISDAENLQNVHSDGSNNGNNVTINIPSIGNNNGKVIEIDTGHVDGEVFSDIQNMKTTILNYLPSLKWLFVVINK